MITITLFHSIVPSYGTSDNFQLVRTRKTRARALLRDGVREFDNAEEYKFVLSTGAVNLFGKRHWQCWSVYMHTYNATWITLVESRRVSLTHDSLINMVGMSAIGRPSYRTPRRIFASKDFY